MSKASRVSPKGSLLGFVEDLRREQHRTVNALDAQFTRCVMDKTPLPKCMLLVDKMERELARVEASKEALVRKAVHVYALAYPDDETDALDWLENNTCIFLAGFLIKCKTPAAKAKHESISAIMAEANDHKKSIAKRARSIYETICGLLKSKRQAHEFALVSIIGACDLHTLERRCVKEKPPTAKYTWNRLDTVCSRILATQDMPPETTISGLKSRVIANLVSED